MFQEKHMIPTERIIAIYLKRQFLHLLPRIPFIFEYLKFISFKIDQNKTYFTI